MQSLMDVWKVISSWLWGKAGGNRFPLQPSNPQSFGREALQICGGFVTPSCKLFFPLKSKWGLLDLSQTLWWGDVSFSCWHPSLSRALLSWGLRSTSLLLGRGSSWLVCPDCRDIEACLQPLRVWLVSLVSLDGSFAAYAVSLPIYKAQKETI